MGRGEEEETGRRRGKSGEEGEEDGVSLCVEKRVAARSLCGRKRGSLWLSLMQKKNTDRQDGHGLRKVTGKNLSILINKINK